jgi:dTDP-4-amino-4,6-dideoxygalactose transaminase
MADARAFATLSERYGVTIVEDACQAHGAEREGIRAGTLGAAAAFSFYPAKNLGALGDAGALVTSHAGVAEAVRVLREHGQRRKYHHDVEGWTSRLDTIQAIALLLKLPYLAAGNEDRRRAAAFYDEALVGVGDLVTSPVPAGSVPAWHLYVVRTADPEGLASHLGTRGIATGRHYPVPVHLTGAYASLGYRRGSFPVAEALAAECLSLPVFPGIAEGQLEAVVGAVVDYFAARG